MHDMGQAVLNWRGIIITVLVCFFGGLNGIVCFVLCFLSNVSREHEREKAEWNGSRLLVMKCDFFGMCIY